MPERKRFFSVDPFPYLFSVVVKTAEEKQAVDEQTPRVSGSFGFAGRSLLTMIVGGEKLDTVDSILFVRWM